METAQVGQKVKVPWGLGFVSGVLKQVYGPPGRLTALVAVHLSGMGSNDADEVVLPLPVDALEPDQDERPSDTRDAPRQEEAPAAS